MEQQQTTECGATTDNRDIVAKCNNVLLEGYPSMKQPDTQSEAQWTERGVDRQTIHSTTYRQTDNQAGMQAGVVSQQRWQNLLERQP